jgi:TRAP-type C4-dicarboxylate transport system permease small subunit
MLVSLWSKLTTVLLLCAAIAIGMAACVTIIDVVGRFAFRFTLQGAIELATLFIGLGVVLSMPMCFTNNENITAELIRGFLSRPLIVFINVLSGIASLVFIAILAWIESRDLAQNWGGFRTLPDTGFPYDKGLLVVAAGFILTTIGALFGFHAMLKKGRE